MTARTIRRMQAEGTAPPFTRIGGSVRYALTDVVAFEAQHRANVQPKEK